MNLERFDANAGNEEVVCALHVGSSLLSSFVTLPPTTTGHRPEAVIPILVDASLVTGQNIELRCRKSGSVTNSDVRSFGETISALLVGGVN